MSLFLPREVAWFGAFFALALGSCAPHRDDTQNADLGPPAFACSTDTCRGPGLVCVDGQCIEDCRRVGAATCAGAFVCDFTDGRCRADGACVLRGSFTSCAEGSNMSTVRCGAGTSCNGAACVPWSAGCTGVSCDTDGRCWGTDCACTRPASCTPTDLAHLNDAAFAGGGVDLDFDAECNAYTVTVLAGPDYLRQLAPDGTLTSFNGTTNLNMGEVRIKRLATGEFSTIGDVAATYICCSTCGCIFDGVDNRLGVVHLDRLSSSRPLPNVIPAQSTAGTAPFGQPALDTGPYGLVWGTDGSLYVGNVLSNGDFHRLDLSAGAPVSVAQFPARIVASAVFDPEHLLVATAGGKLYLAAVTGGSYVPFVTLGGEVTSMRRDRYLGDVYVELRTGAGTSDIVKIDPSGTQVSSFQTPGQVGRIALSPDGRVYHLPVLPNASAPGAGIESWPLPAAR